MTAAVAAPTEAMCDPAAPCGTAPACAVLSRELNEPMAGTTPPHTAWLLIEHEGAWTRNAVERVLGTLPNDLQAGIARACRTGLRPMLLRHPGRHPRQPGMPRTVFLASSRVGAEWLERLEVHDLTELGRIDLDAVTAGRPGHGTPVHHPLLLVCTHGTKDMCCAVEGRPLAESLAASLPGLVWECSHLGGDRFAGNVAVLPWGEYHGRLDPVAAEHVAAAAMRGDVAYDHLRGRAGYDVWQQAAEHAVRRGTGAMARDAVSCGPTAVDGDEPVVEVTTADAVWEVRLGRAGRAALSPTRCTHIAAGSSIVVRSVRVRATSAA